MIHHNLDPARCLAHVAQALKPDGVLELMVYNRFHRREHSAFQRAVRLLEGNGPQDHRATLDIGRRLAASAPRGGQLHARLAEFGEQSDEAWADSWINPRETDYTVEDLVRLTDSCGLRIETPVVNRFDQVAGSMYWYQSFGDARLAELFERLSDLDRWQFVNLFLLERSPMLWFYLGRADRGPRMTDSERNTAFLDTIFRKTQCGGKSFVPTEGGRYVPASQKLLFPAGLPATEVRSLYSEVNGKVSIRSIFNRLGISPTPESAYKARLQLTNAIFPYLEAVAG